MGSVIYLQAGGPTSVINSSLNGVIRRCRDRGVKVYGARNGLFGLINNNLVELTNLSYNRLVLLRQTPGMALGSSRQKIDETFSHWKEVEQTLISVDCDYLLVNGGNDSMDMAHQLHKHFASWGLKVIGIPKTIDNDLFGTDFCPGYPSAVRHVNNTFAAIKIDGSVYPKGKVNLVEIEGREAGWLTAGTALLKKEATPDGIYLPEVHFDIETFLKKAQEIYEKKGSCFFAISEGVDVPHQEFGTADSFGHVSPEGAVYELAGIIKKRLGLPVRASVLGTPCRADPYCISKVDSDCAQFLGEAAVDAAIAGKNGVMVGLERSNEKKLHFTVRYQPLQDCGAKDHLFPHEWIRDDGTISPEFSAYLSPLLNGTVAAKTDSFGNFLYAVI